MIDTMDRIDKTDTDYCDRNHRQTRQINIVITTGIKAL